MRRTCAFSVATLLSLSEVAAASTCRVVQAFPHDTKAFTEGLVIQKGVLYESVGRHARRSLRRVVLASGKVAREAGVGQRYFGEGLTLLDGKLYQLTLKDRRVFVYDAKTLVLRRAFNYAWDGWGLTNDGKSLIASDGTGKLRFLNPATFRLERTLTVTDGGKPVHGLNELEYVKGEIYANVFLADRIARISPADGRVLGWLDLGDLLPVTERRNRNAVLNGIAYDAEADRLFVTGKYWPRLFEIRCNR